MLPNHAPLVVAEQAGHWELGLKAIPIHTSFLVEPPARIEDPLGVPSARRKAFTASADQSTIIFDEPVSRPLAQE
jgi:hypothetical protein